MIEFRLGMLEEDLKMSPAQLRLWEPYAERMRAAVADIVRERAPTQSIGAPNAMQQMNRSVDQARNRLTALEDVAVAAKAFYEVLSPEQKMLLDARSPSILPLLSGGSTQALRLVKQHAPDLALVDLFMPGMDGLELIQALRTAHPNCKIIAMVFTNIKMINS